MHQVYLLLGSNLGSREALLADCRKLLEENIGRIINASSLYETASWGKQDQPPFINQVLLVESKLAAHQILKQIIKIERLLGRVRVEKWTARTIDIDILFYDDEIIDKPDLKVPHPFLHLRKFTLEPLIELQPNLFHPVLKQTITELYRRLSDTLSVKRIN